jgi:hypothetical protein
MGQGMEPLTCDSVGDRVKRYEKRDPVPLKMYAIYANVSYDVGFFDQ